MDAITSLARPESPVGPFEQTEGISGTLLSPSPLSQYSLRKQTGSDMSTSDMPTTMAMPPKGIQLKDSSGTAASSAPPPPCHDFCLGRWVYIPSRYHRHLTTSVE